MPISGLLSRSTGVLAFLLSTGVAFAGPAITVSPVAGPPTTTIKVSGTGFGAKAAVDIYFDTTDVCVALATAAGAISCGIEAPYYAQPQTHYISAVQRNTGTGDQKAFTVRTDWAQFHGMNAKHTGFNPYENTINTSNVRNLDILWTAPIGSSGTYGTPTVVAGRVYIGGINGKLYSFSNKNGATFAGWPKTLGGVADDNSPAVGGGIVYVGTSSNKLHAFNAVSGVAIAGFPITLGGSIIASPTLFGGNVYVACYDGKIYAFNAATGAPVSGFPVTVGAADATVSGANGRIFEGSTNNYFYAFDVATGGAIAGYPVATGNDVQSTAAIVSGQVFFGSDDFKLYGVRRADGTALSGFPVTTAGAVDSSPAVGDGQVIVASTDAHVYSRDPATGASRWTSPALETAASVGSPVIANGVVYINTNLSLYALNETSGAILWRASVLTGGYASPTVADGIVYIASTDGNLYAFSVNGVFPASRLPGGELGVKPAISSLKPDYSLKATMH